MFNFKKKTMNPLVRAALSEIDFSFKVEDPQAKVEKLLSVDEMVQSEFAKARATQENKMGTAAAFTLASLAVATFGFFVSGGLALAGVAGILAGFGATLKFAANTDRVTADMNTLRTIIGTEVARTAEQAPAEAVRSPRFLRSIAESFRNAAHEGLKGTPEKLRARVAWQPQTPAA